MCETVCAILLLNISLMFYTVHVVVFSNAQFDMLYSMVVLQDVQLYILYSTCDCIARHTAWCAVLHVIVLPGIQLDVLYYM